MEILRYIYIYKEEEEYGIYSDYRAIGIYTSNAFNI